jgi:zinc protease
MKLSPLAVPVFLLLSMLGAGRAQARNIFPYAIHSKKLANGLKVIMVPFDSPGIIAYYSIVRAGSRNETEPGRSGFAHFFEHMMFRGTDKYSPEAYNRLFKELGSDANAYTSDDYTYYYAVFGKTGLEKVIEAEADRFQNLKYGVPAFKQESQAVLGEYYKNYSDPSSKLYEKLRDTAFQVHTYKHTTMGFLRDIEDMPNQYEYSLKFYDRWYRPGNVVIFVVGDIDVDRTFALIDKYYGKWEPKPYELNIPREPMQNEFKCAHIDWENETLPYVALGYKMPAFDPSKKENAGMQILAELLFGPTSDLYKKLVIQDQSVEYIRASAPNHRDPFLFMVFTRVKRDDLIKEVQDQIFSAIENIQMTTVDQSKLDAIKSRMKYSFAMNLDTAASIGGALTPFIELSGNADSVNEFYERYDEVTCQDLRDLALRYLTKTNCTEVTLTGVKK